MTRIRPAATRRPIRLVLALVLMLPATAAWAPAAVAQDPVIAAAGDIACAPGDPVTADTCHQQATSDLLVAGSARRGAPARRHPVRQRLAGQHPGVYDPTWGRVKAISRPIVGNHEGSGSGYFDYFNGAGVSDGPAGLQRQGLVQLRRRHVAPGGAQLELR